MPILGTIASQVPANLPTNSFISIATSTVGSGGASSISFNSIPSTYKHLQIRGIAKWGSAYTAYSRIQFNGDTGANYVQHRMEGYGSGAVTAAGYTGETSGIIGVNSDTQWGLSITDVLDYSSTNKYKTVKTIGGYDNNGSGGLALSSTLWSSTSAVTSIILLPSNGVTFIENSTFALYGIKG